MAQRRRQAGAVAPAELLEFDPARWPAREWWESVTLWSAARHEWVKVHPDSPIGSMLEAMREERRVMDEHRAEMFHGDAL